MGKLTSRAEENSPLSCPPLKTSHNKKVDETKQFEGVEGGRGGERERDEGGGGGEEGQLGKTSSVLSPFPTLPVFLGFL